MSRQRFSEEFMALGRAAGVTIHPTAVVDPTACLGEAVEIGPYAIIGARARIGDRTRLRAAIVEARTVIGADCDLYPGSAVGGGPQIRGATRPWGSVIVGDRTVIREHVTVHAAGADARHTTIGRDVYLMAGSHVAHDCRIGDGVTIANGALLAGFVSVGDHAFVSGNVVIHQYVRIGDLAMLSGLARVSKDVPPYMVVVRSRVRGINVVGMRRVGMSSAQRDTVRDAYRTLYRCGLATSHALDRLRQLPPARERDVLVSFIERSTRGICAAPRKSEISQREPGNPRSSP
jgi:UDP-N-acetylglucosamine acyltransferase